MGDLIEKDFGARTRQSARTFARLLGLLDSHASDVLARPGHYLDLMGKENLRLYSALRKADDCLRIPVTAYTKELPSVHRTVVVCADEYARLIACANAVRDGLASKPAGGEG
jgi:hypothetical protein